MSYESPIEVISSQIQIEQEKRIEGDILYAVHKLGINVDKEQLLKALQYDRNQYEKGYKDGHDDGYADANKWIPADIICPDDSGFYLVCVKDEIDVIHVTTAYYVASLYGWGNIRVTHWQPLPVPPAEREEL